MVAALALADIRFASLWMAEERSLGESPTAEVVWTRAAARGDRQAFARLVDLHKRTVYGLCVRLLRDAEEARDAAQESFARAYAALATYDAGQPFAPWVLRIARNHCLDVLRRRLPDAQRVELDAAPGDGPATELADDRAPSGRRRPRAARARRLPSSGRSRRSRRTTARSSTSSTSSTSPTGRSPRRSTSPSAP